MSSETIPVIDISPFYEPGDIDSKKQVARQIDETYRRVGFLVVKGHPIPDDLIADMRSVCMEFFKLPDTYKRQYKMPEDCYRGYTPMGTEGLSYSLDNEAPPDLKESYSSGPTGFAKDDYHCGEQAGAFFAENFWPDEPKQMSNVWESYYAANEALASDLMELFALALDIDKTFFQDKIDKHISNFSAIHYPAQNTPPHKDQLRAGAHTDYGSLTLVHQENAPGGLQVHTEGQWIDVPYIPNTFVVNIGDLMAEWTNDRWVSTLHRVVNPPTKQAEISGRLSLCFFHQPNYDAQVQVLSSCISPDNPARYPDTTSGEHVRMKVLKHRTPGLENAEKR